MIYYLRSLLTILAIIPLSLQAQESSTAFGVKVSVKEDKEKVPQYSKTIIQEQLLDLSICFDYTLNKPILNYIRDYTLLARNKTEGTLGRTMIYFPIFEYHLEKYGLPDDLKALAIIESALKPTRVSHKGASGLWQFMPATARQYGITIDDYVDERNNPYKATEAAMKHLSRLHARFGNWKLAIAAYNCGSSRMNQAIKKGKSRDYDSLKKYLPKETQNYIDKYVAASYVINYYLYYGLHPKYPDYNYSVTKALEVTYYTNFQSLQEETGIALGVLEELNPGFKKGIVPPNKHGNYIIVPKIGSKKESTKVLAKQKN